MAGLTSEGFTPKTLSEIETNIKSKLNVLSPNFDFSPESPDGQMLGIMSFEISQAWSELNLVYRSYDPTQATGAALRNIGLISGLEYGAATRSQATVSLTGTTGTLVPAGSIVENADGNKFTTSFDVKIPANVQVVAVLSGVIPVPAGSISIVGTTITGWTGVTQALEGDVGAVAQSEQAYRTLRSRTVLMNYTGNVEAIRSRLFELGLEQVAILENNTNSPSGTGQAGHTIAVTVNPVGTITDEEIARVILETKPAGIGTHGTTTVVLDDSQGNSQTIKFTKAAAVNIYMNVDVTYLTEDFAGAEEQIIGALVDHINSLQVGEDVIHSRLYSLITPYGKAQVNTLEIGKVNGTETAANVVIDDDEFAFCAAANIDFTGA